MKRVLVVDDNDDNLQYLKTVLSADDFTVIVARQGAEALAVGRQSPPDLVISDLLMPVMDGYTLLRLWKSDEQLHGVPFIVYSATYTDPEDVDLAMRLGADAFILKPVEPDELLGRIRSLEGARPESEPLASKNPGVDERELLQVYNKTLVRKLEHKMRELEEANESLQRDIAERKRVEEEVRWKTAFLEAQVESSIDGILVVDAEGRQILKNERFGELWNLPPELAREKNDAIVLEYAAARTKDPGAFLEKVNRLYNHPEDVSRDEVELLDGRILDRYSSPVRDRAGRYYGRIWTFRDITEKRNLEAQLRQAQKMEAFGQLAGGVAHDFNNILAVVQLQAGVLKMDSSLSVRVQEAADQIEKAAERASNLTRRLLLLSSRRKLQAQNIDLKEVVNTIAKMLRRMIGEQIELTFKFPDHPLFVHADLGMIDQILLNLAVNARDAMPKGGRILIEISTVELSGAEVKANSKKKSGSYAKLSVTDTGSGIPPDVVPRIFEPFFTTKDNGKGTGLGLATVFAIVQQHGGWIDVESVVGEGTAFTIFLPSRTADVRREDSSTPVAAVLGGDETILLVEDQVSVRDSLHTILTRLGYNLLEAANSREALQLWEKNRGSIQLLLTDLVLPGGVNGAELAARLAAENPELKAVYISGYDTDLTETSVALEEGVNFLTKPFDFHRLANIIRLNLGRLPAP